MQRAEDDVAGFGGSDRGGDRFQVSHFADEDDVGVHPECSPQSFRERRHVDTDFALIDCRLLVIVVVLDRVFQRDDVMINIVVDPVDHAGQTGGLAGTGRPGDQEQASRPLNEFPHDGR